MNYFTLKKWYYLIIDYHIHVGTDEIKLEIKLEITQGKKDKPT